jgi:hypothetical protein
MYKKTATGNFLQKKQFESTYVTVVEKKCLTTIERGAKII